MGITEGIMELHLHILDVEEGHLLEVHLRFIHLEHQGEDMAKEEVIIIDLETIMCQMGREDLQDHLRLVAMKELVLEAVVAGIDKTGMIGDPDTEVVGLRCNP